jgi:NMD protein affecting ribosome stability and mRNA decay
MSDVRNCLECGYKLDDGYTLEETLCGACYNIENDIDQEEATL